MPNRPNERSRRWIPALEELLDDYRDFLRARDLPIWDKNSKEARYVRRLGTKKCQTFEDYREFVETRPAEVVANIALCRSTKPITCSTSSSASWRRILSRKAACASG